VKERLVDSKIIWNRPGGNENAGGGNLDNSFSLDFCFSSSRALNELLFEPSNLLNEKTSIY